MEPLEINIKYFGMSPWEIEVIYGIFKDRFKVEQEETESTETDFVSGLNVSIPLEFNIEFFKWFDFRRWEKFEFILKEMKRRRRRGKTIKIDISFTGNPKVRFIVDSEDRHWFNYAVEKIDFVLELLPYHLDPEKLPKDFTEVIYQFDSNAARWRLNSVIVKDKKFVFAENVWKLIT